MLSIAPALMSARAGFVGAGQAAQAVAGFGVGFGLALLACAARLSRSQKEQELFIRRPE
jgi:phosphoglycerate dehydrogenase-like enzyme